MLVGQQISKSFGNFTALQNVNISIKKSSITSIFGPSGSGKTTLIKALSMLEPPDSGRISLEKSEYTYPDKKNKNINVWPKITVVFQQHFLWPHLSLKNNILLPLEKQSDKYALLDEMIDLFDMSSFIDRYPNQVSLGQRQRVALARAIVLNPDYLLLDEITSALDVEQTYILLNKLIGLRKRDMGILIVTHLMDFVKNILSNNNSDQFIFLDKGQVIETGNHKEFTTPKTKRLNEFLNHYKIIQNGN